ncbi:MAG: ferritin-like domain-containing protein [Burkholderiales bacterium]|nr:ferritin-like domain-containing protein [Burkholderiales bacterium]
MLRTEALQALLVTDPDRKAVAVRAIDAGAPFDAAAVIAEPPGIPGRGARPPLVPHAQLARRSMASAEGRAALIHALAHIEANAVNLALDIVWRFPAMPEAFYRDWIVVAQEEALHYTLLREHLRSLGHAYGDFPAHDALWEMAKKTRHDVIARVALVPRTLETRGLDASPPIKAKLVKVGDARAGEILDIILRDEIGHVALGNRWFRWLCTERGLDPVVTYAELAALHHAPRPRGPFNLEARRAAGFTEDELQALQPGPPAGAARRRL